MTKCQSCLDDRRVVYRFTSDVINLTVRGELRRGSGRLGLAVEVFSVGEFKNPPGPR